MIHDIDEATNQAERLAHSLDSIRHTYPGLTDSDKEEIWDMVLALTGMSAALWRIRVLAEHD